MSNSKSFLHTPLSAWLNRTQPLPPRFYTPGYKDAIKDSWSIWLSVEEVALLHNAPSMNWIGLKEARRNTKEYLESADEIINGLEGGWLDREEQGWLRETLGEAPLPSLPIYLITCANESREELVYVGKTVNSSRFTGGHSAALKLHAPEYSNKVKKIYRSTVWLHDDHDYISFDWVQPEELAVALLDSVESQLIYTFQPALNTDKKRKNYAKWDFYIHIQNFLEGRFLNDEFI
ncbi:hypothetical protein [Halodesulfovibrio aestuarii]|uniref:hypothetical protein n=1 Tax=Halodesulfovibrio aestuarii TaxID=126333 RepID=UPI003D33BB48